MAEIPSAPKTPKAAALVERALLIAENANPFLPGIGSAILSGVQLVQAIRGYFMGLGESCILILETLSRLEPRDDAGRTRLEEDAKLVEDVVRYIEKAVRSRSRKSSFLKRLWNYLTYKRIYEECQSRIENALHLFNLQAVIELRQQVAGMLAASAPQTRVLQL